MSVQHMVICKCGKTEKIKTSWTSRNLGRRFYRCPNCGFIGWIDPLMCYRAVDVIPGLFKAKNELEEDLKERVSLTREKYALAECLNAIVNEAVKKGVFKGVKIRRNNVVCFEEVSGLRVNYNKSKLYRVGVSDAELSDMARWMKCGMGEIPFTYLGLPTGDNMSRVSAWNSVVEKFKSRLAEWKAKTISFGRRLTLVKSVSRSLPLYYFSMLRVPLSVIK
ncbi:reverse transcriptase domain, reverse transcriptase zinc-binding domain protein [Tanacetum coccineum]